MENSEISGRLKELIFSLGSNQTKFAESIGVSQTAIFKIVNGQTKPGYALTEAIFKKYPQINREWFSTGSGEMFKNLPSPAVAFEGGEYLQEHLRRLEENFQRLNQQLEVKDQQIAAKDRQIEMLISQLGKLSGVIEGAQVVPLWEENKATA